MLAIGVECAALSLLRPERNQFAYRLNDAPWTFLGYRNQIELRNLPVGRHCLQIKAANAGGRWSAANREAPYFRPVSRVARG